jgi:hypothetical protein
LQAADLGEPPSQPLSRDNVDGYYHRIQVFFHRPGAQQRVKWTTRPLDRVRFERPLTFAGQARKGARSMPQAPSVAYDRTSAFLGERDAGRLAAPTI